MRLATFRPGPGIPEVSLSAFPGDTGGLLANVNRWRGQIGLEPIDEAQLARTVETVVAEGVSVTIVDMTGSAESGGVAMLGAVIVPGDGKTWFLKATGEPPAIAVMKPVFITFARSFRVQREPSNEGGRSGEGGGVVADKPGGGTGDVQARLKAWKPPSHWSADPNASTFVAAAYDATNPDGGAKITATMLLNDAGGVLANVNRWRDQLGLPVIEKVEQQPMTDLGAGSVLVDLSSADRARRMIIAMVPAQGQTWFFKITGSTQGVEVERVSFDGLVHRVGLGDGAP